MGFTKNKAWSIVIALILIIVFNVTMFMLPLEHGVMFWMGYSFEIFSDIFRYPNSIVGKTDDRRAIPLYIRDYRRCCFSGVCEYLADIDFCCRA